MTVLAMEIPIVCMLAIFYLWNLKIGQIVYIQGKRNLKMVSLIYNREIW